MRINPPASRAYTYKVTTPPAETPISVAEVKQQLKITHSLEDALLAIYINAAVHYAEQLTRRDLIQRTYTTYRDFFPPSISEGYYFAQGIGSHSLSGWEIRKSPLAGITEITYTDTQDVAQTVDPTTYYATFEDDYSEVLLNPDKCWPTDCIARLQSIQIVFTCGLFNDASEVTSDWKAALLAHVTAMYSNRGDCDSDSCASVVPQTAKAFYMQNRILNL